MLLAPFKFEKYPEGHGVHISAPAPEYFPGEHSVQDELPRLEKDPASQQTPAPENDLALELITAQSMHEVAAVEG